MATPASRMMLFSNAKTLPFHLLRPRLSCTTTATDIPAFLSSAITQHQGSNLVKFLLGVQSTVASAADNVGVVFYPTFGGDGEMGRVEARGKKVVVDDNSDGIDDNDDVSDGDFYDDGDDWMMMTSAAAEGKDYGAKDDY